MKRPFRERSETTVSVLVILDRGRARTLTVRADVESVLRSLAVVLLLLAAASTGTAAQSPCGVERWLVKTVRDRDAGKVRPGLMATTIAELASRSRPIAKLGQDRRTGDTERTTFVVRAQLVRVISESDHDLHLVLRDLREARVTLVAEIPDSLCALGSPFAGAFAAARRALRATPRNAIIEVVGIGFFDYLHGQSGMAKNGLELHPVLKLRFVAPSPRRRPSGGREE